MFYYQMGLWGLGNWGWQMMLPRLLSGAGVIDIFISAFQNRNSTP